jgi:hemoglobin-like flavoprotein
LFYDRLFTIDLSTRALFGKADIAGQGMKLMSTLGFVIAALRQPDSMLATVRALAARHVGYGVVDAHYSTVGIALLWTIEQGLGEACSPEILEAWAAAYALLSAVMIAASHEHAALGAAA